MISSKTSLETKTNKTNNNIHLYFIQKKHALKMPLVTPEMLKPMEEKNKAEAEMRKLAREQRHEQKQHGGANNPEGDSDLTPADDSNKQDSNSARV